MTILRVRNLKNREVVVIASAITNAFSKASAFIVTIVAVRLSLDYLGEEAFGLWMTLASLITMLSFLDFGIGNALINKVAESAHSNPKRLPELIAFNLLCVTFLALSLGALLHVFSSSIPWDSLIKFKDESLRPQFYLSLQIFYVLFPINLIVNAGQKVLLGLQKAPVVNSLNLLGSVLSLLFIIYLTGEKKPIPDLILGTIGVQLLTNIYIFVYLYRKKLFQIPKLFLNNINGLNGVFKNSGYFFIIQLGSFAGWGVDGIFISSGLGVIFVAQYTILQKLFQLISQPLAIINGPLWVAYADAKAKEEQDFIYRSFKNSMVITLMVTGLLGLLLLVFGQSIVSYWTNGKITLSYGLLALYLTWIFCETMGNCFAMLLNGIGFLRPQVISTILFVVLAIIFKWIGTNFGLEIFILGGIAAYLISTPIFYFLFYRVEIKRLLRAI